MKLKVVKSYSTQYNDPIILTKGDTVKLGVEEELEKWRGWIWATSGNISGWIPKNIVQTKDYISGIVLENYSAKELSVNMGEIVTQLKELNGWIWAKNTKSGEEGWIPKENVESND